MVADAAALLVETTLATSAATGLVLLLRVPVRRVFGAGGAYALWWLVPAALVAVLLPAAVEPVVPPLRDAVEFTARVPLARPGPGAANGAIDALAATWAVGAIAMLAAMAWRQRRFVAGLGPLQRTPDGHLRSVATRGLPAVIGLRPRIVLPGDFEQRYTAPERDLVLAHERVHVRRGDVPACALAGLLRALFWFNPLLHAAVSRFRRDQEFACDAAVLRRHPDQRRAYGEALLKTRLGGEPLPFGCHGFGTHPMKERFAMITRTQPSTRRHLAGLAVGGLLALATAATAWATQPAGVADIPAGKVAMDLAFKVDDDADFARTTTLVLAPGEPGHENFEHDGERWETTWAVTPLPDGTFDVSGKIVRDSVVVADPRMIARDTAAVGVGRKDDAGAFHGIAVELAFRLGPPAPGMAAVGIRGDVPAYPPGASDAGEGGVVMLELVVGVDGKVVDAKVLADGSTIAADSPLAINTLQAAREWTLDPATENGVPVQGTVRVPVRFEPDPAD